MRKLLAFSTTACLLAFAACTPNTPGSSVSETDGGGAGTQTDGGGSANPDGGGASSGGGSSGTGSGASSSGAAASSGGATSGASSSGAASASGSTSSGAASASSSAGGAASSSAAASSSSAAASSSSSSTGGVACSGARDCNLGEICLNSVCTAGCTTPSDCPQGAPLCDTTVAPNGACVECVDAGDCGNGQVCDLGTCRSSCTSTGQCAFPLTCRMDTMVCVRCTEDAQCGFGRICEANECVEGCRMDSQCQPGNVCAANECVQGCRATPNSCPAGSRCDATLGTAGLCVAGCTQASDCGDPNVFTCTNMQCVRNCGGDSECAPGSVCEGGSCVAGCRPPTRDCPRGQYCTSTASGTAGQCLAGCDTAEDCAFQLENVCNTTTHACVECLATMDCTLDGNVTAVCTAQNTCDITCDPNAGFDVCRTIGFFCSSSGGNTGTCVQCEDATDCDAFELCTDNRCVAQGNRPLCAECDDDAQCGGANDLCVTRFVSGRQERVCGVDCSGGQTCPAGTACTQVGGAGGNPIRGQQCLPVNSVAPATCAARNDMLAEQQCGRNFDCGLGAVDAQLDRDGICSGAGRSIDHCSVFCTMGGNDCPAGFACEDPPDTANQEFRPRCGKL